MPPQKTKRGYIVTLADDQNNQRNEYVSGQNPPYSNVTIDGKEGRLYESNLFDPQKEIDAIIANIVKRKPVLAPYLKGLKVPDSYYQYMKGDPFSEQAPEMVQNIKTTFGQMATRFLPNNFVDTGLVEYKHFDNFGLPSLAGMFAISPQKQSELANLPEFDEIALELCEDVTAVLNKSQEKVNCAIPNGVDASRNHEAMEDVANLLGLSEMVAKSERVPIVKNGKVQFDTFVEQPKGHNVADKKQDNIFLDENHNPLMDAEALRLMSNMSVMDYITGATKYDWTDLTFQTDPNNPSKITNIVRHNSGTCFSLCPSDKKIDPASTYPCLGDLRVISESTAQKVMSLNEDRLKFALSGKGLTDEQINKCWERVTALQNVLREPVNEITDGKVMIVKDDKFGELDRQKLYTSISALNSGEQLPTDILFASEYCKNMFARATAIREVAKTNYKARATETTEEAYDHVFKFDGKVKIASEKELNFETLSARFKEVDPPLLISSKEFRNMKTAMRDTEKLLRDINKKSAVNGGLSPRDIDALHSSFKEVKKWSTQYISKKNNGVIKGTHGRERYDFAKQIDGYADKICKSLEQMVEKSNSGPKLNEVNAVRKGRDVPANNGPQNMI